MYYLISGIYLLSMSLIWRNDGGYNTLLKFAQLFLGIWGLWEYALITGYVFKVGS